LSAHIMFQARTTMWEFCQPLTGNCWSHQLVLPYTNTAMH